MIKKRVVLLMCSVFILTGCNNISESSVYNKFSKELNDVYYFDVEEGFKEVKLEIDLNVEKGSVKFELKNPNEDVGWSEVVKGDFHEIKDLDKIEGKWELRFESLDSDTNGELNIKFSGK
ncbi:MAG: hypothetical protein N4A48_06870 [Tepidibacter sp.]|jgi:uncharacterized lipoprotein NlpE involved in copper resistance|uniref:hypothetical protein n=1 Tax=Tepidibacter sp. TaxID=2529387 RepID=UPI0025E338FF|nr:hypothetical protein [Tepidibacter sp.]MCT4508471.1 hypothetical protein [Tepidibacter sp.]